MSESTASFRDALSRFASGVVVIAAHAPDGPVGFTASAFSSLSLEPPLVLFCVAKKASAYARIMTVETVGISILHAGQGWIAEQFAKHGVDRFQGVPLRADAPVPLIDGSIAQLTCSRHALHDAGDHTIWVAAVLDSRTTPGAPLVHFARALGGFAHEPSHSERHGDTDRPGGGRG